MFLHDERCRRDIGKQNPLSKSELKDVADIAAVAGLIDMIPSRAGCSFDEVPSFSPRTGGAPANVCAAFARLGGKSAFLSQLGDDPFGHKIARELADCGIDLSHLAFTDKANTALAFVSLEEDGSRTFSFYRKPSADLLYRCV